MHDYNCFLFEKKFESVSTVKIANSSLSAKIFVMISSKSSSDDVIDVACLASFPDNTQIVCKISQKFFALNFLSKVAENP